MVGFPELLIIGAVLALAALVVVVIRNSARSGK